MAIRLSGMNSGLDTDAIVQALVSSYSFKKTKYEKAQTKLGWKQDAWKSLNTKVYSFYSSVSNLRFTSAYNLKKTTVSDATKATVKASSGAPNGTQTLKIKETAKAGYLTGEKINAASASTTLAELGYNGGDAKINVNKGDGTTTTITLSATSKLSDVQKELKNAGLEANYDATYKRFYISSKETGVKNDFTITGANADGATALYKLGIADASTKDVYAKYDSLYGAGTGAGSTVDNIQKEVEAYKTAQTEAKKYEQQSANLLKGISYGTAYSSVMDYYDANAITDTEKFSTLAGLGAKRDSALIMQNDDSTYTTYYKTTGKDADGNAVYADGNGNYISAQERYEYNGVTYKKNEDGKYVSVEDDSVLDGVDTKDLNKTVTYFAATEKKSYVDADDKEYTKIEEEGQPVKYQDSEGKVYVKNDKDGKYYQVKDDGSGEPDTDTEAVAIKEKFTYEVNTNVDLSAKTENASEAYKSMTADLDEAALKEYEANLATVNSFEKQNDSAVLGDTDEYKVSDIVDAVHKAYEDGGKDAVKELIAGNGNADNSFASLVGSLTQKAEATTAEKEKHNLVKDLAQIEDTTSEAYKKALDNLEEMVNTAHDIVSNPNGVEYNAVNKVTATDAIIELNGVEYTDSSNTFTINNLTITAMAKTAPDEEISITTSTDVQGIYDKIKDFLTEYNNIVNEITGLYNADSAKGYEPLTDEEKEEMSDSEIEKWEQKIKDSILRNDSTLSGVLSAMQTAMSTGIEVNGKKYSLTNFGIQTLGYLNAAKNEQNAYHIDGDEDDVNTSGKTDKLMAAITNDPDTVIEYMQKLSTNLYNAIGNKMSATSLSSAFTIYNDKQMSKEYTEYTKLIKEWEEKISTKEDYYYNKFTSMETALAKLNSTQSSLSGFFGQ